MRYKLPTLFALVAAASLVQTPTLFAQESPDDFNFETLVKSPNHEVSHSVKSVFNNSTSLLFYSDASTESSNSGFFKLNTNLNNWQQFRLPVSVNTNDNSTDTIVDAATGPFNTTVVLSTKQTSDGETTQYLSATHNGSIWDTQKINLTNRNFTKVTTTDAYNLKNFVVYGENSNSVLRSGEGEMWVYDSFPNTCLINKNCTYANKHVTNVSNGFLLLQSRVTESQDEDSNCDQQTTNTTKKTESSLLFSYDFRTWYTVEFPFAKHQVNSVFKTHRNGIIASVTNPEDGSHKLWFTHDYQNWRSFDLASDVKLLDAKTGYRNYLTLSLGHHNTSDVVILDPDHDTRYTFASFEGQVTSLDWHNNSLYLSGDFVNFRDNTKALLVNMTKKSSDDNCDNNSDENTDENTKGTQTTLDVNALKVFTAG